MPGLDAARALSVIAMVFGHTAEALLSLEARAHPWVQTYWGFRGLTAPVFLFVSGWAVVTSMSRSGLVGRALLERHFPRVLLLLGLGLLLRLPAWDFGGLFFRFDGVLWAHWLGFDALQCIAVSLLLGVAVLAWVPSWTVRVAILVGLVIGVPLISAAVDQLVRGSALPVPFSSALRSDASSPFPLLPWSAYFFAGALVGTCLHVLQARRVDARWATPALVLIGALMTWSATAGALHNAPRTSAVLFFSRLGQVLIIASGALLLPRRIAQPLSPIGRSALTVYVAHLPLVYGWAYFPGLVGWVGRMLDVWEVAMLAALLLAFGLALAKVIRDKPWFAWRPRPAAATVGE